MVVVSNHTLFDTMPTIVKKTALKLLKGNETVFNKTQMGRLRKAVTQKAKRKIIAEVQKKRPKMPKAVYNTNLPDFSLLNPKKTRAKPKKRCPTRRAGAGLFGGRHRNKMA